VYDLLPHLASALKTDFVSLVRSFFLSNRPVPVAILNLTSYARDSSSVVRLVTDDVASDTACLQPFFAI